MSQTLNLKFIFRFFVIWQFSFLTIAGLLLMPISSIYAYSYMVGAIVFAGPNLYFVYYAFRYQGSENAGLIARSMRKGHTGKLIITAMLFALVFRMIHPLSSEMVFLGFSTMVFLHMFLAYRVLKS